MFSDGNHRKGDTSRLHTHTHICIFCFVFPIYTIFMSFSEGIKRKNSETHGPTYLLNTSLNFLSNKMISYVITYVYICSVCMYCTYTYMTSGERSGYSGRSILVHCSCCSVSLLTTWFSNLTRKLKIVRDMLRAQKVSVFGWATPRVPRFVRRSLPAYFHTFLSSCL